MTSASHAEGRQLDPGQVYLQSRCVKGQRLFKTRRTTENQCACLFFWPQSLLYAAEARPFPPSKQHTCCWRGGGLFGYPVRRRSQSSWSSTSCCHHPGAGPSELSTPSGPTQPHWGQSGLRNRDFSRKALRSGGGGGLFEK